MRLFFLPVFALLLPLAGCASEERLTCPTPESGQEAGTIRETPAQMAQAGEALGAGRADDIRTVAAVVRTRHPAARTDELVNYLISAYCPRINDRAGLSRADKAAALSAFSGQVESVLQAPER